VRDSDRCPLGQCREVETLEHLQCHCPVTKGARIEVHHRIWRRLVELIREHSEASNYLLITEKSTRGMAKEARHWHADEGAQGQWYTAMHTLARVLKTSDRPGLPPGRWDAQRKKTLGQRPDGIFLHWSERRFHILEFTRTYDSDGQSLNRADGRKQKKYTRLCRYYQAVLPGWQGSVLPFTVGVRGSLGLTTFCNNLRTLAVPRPEHERIAKSVITITLEGLERMFSVRRARLLGQDVPSILTSTPDPRAGPDPVTHTSAPGPRGKRDREKEDAHQEGDLQRTLAGDNNNKKQRIELSRLRQATIAAASQEARARRSNGERTLEGGGSSERERVREKGTAGTGGGEGSHQQVAQRGAERELRGKGGRDRKRERAADDGGDRTRASSSAASRTDGKAATTAAHRGREGSHKQGEERRRVNHTDTSSPHHTSSTTEHR